MNEILPASNPSDSFAELRIRHREIVTNFVNLLAKSARGDGHKAWTLAVKQVMQQLAEKETSQLEFLGTLKLDEKTNREWLIDAIWYFRSSDENTEAILLALESEWNN